LVRERSQFLQCANAFQRQLFIDREIIFHVGEPGTSVPGIVAQSTFADATLSLPMSAGSRQRLGAFESGIEQKGESPFQVDVLRPVTDGYRVIARWGGKLPEVNDRSATSVNSIRPDRLASLPSKGEA
jgi:hypothetical protein